MTPLDLAQARREGLFLWGDMTLRVYLTPVVAQSFGWDTSGVTGAMTLRQALKVMANQWSGPILIGGVEI